MTEMNVPIPFFFSGHFSCNSLRPSLIYCIEFFPVLLQNIFPIKPNPVLRAKLLGLVQGAYRFVQTAAAVIQQRQQVEPVAQVIVTVQPEDSFVLGRTSRNLVKSFNEPKLILPVLDGAG
jgi:hypothetical protein